MDQRARQPRVPRRARRQLVQLLPAATRPIARLRRTTVRARAASTPRPATSARRLPTTRYQDQKRYKPQFYVTCRTSRTAGTAATTSSSATTGSATAASSAARSRSTSYYRDQQRRGRTSSSSTTRRTRRINDVVYNAGFISDTWKFNDRLTFNLGLRFEHYVDSFPEQVHDAERPAAARELAGDLNPAERARYLGLHRAAYGRGARRRAHVQRVAARRLCLRPDRRQPHRAQGLLRPLLLQLGRHARRPGEPGRQRARLRYQWPRSERQPPARRPAGARRCSASTQGGAGFVDVDRQPQAARTRRRSRRTSSARSSSGLSGRVLLRLQERARRVGRDRSDRARRRYTIPIHGPRPRRRRRRRHRRRPDVATCSIGRRRRRRSRSSRTRRTRPSTATSTRSSSPSTAASPASGCC